MKSKSAKILLRKASDAFNSGKYREAEAHTIELVKISGADFRSWEFLGVIQMQLQKYENALVSIKRSIELSDKDESPYINLGVLYKKLGNKEKSILAYKKALEINPKSASAHNNLANLLRQIGVYDEAERHAKNAVCLDSNYAAAYSNLALIQFELGNNIDAARRNCEKALEINPQFAEAHNNLGIILAEMGDFSGAKSCYETAILFDELLLEAKVNLGGVLFKLNEISLSTKILTEVLIYDPENLSAKLGLAQIAITENRIQDGVDLYKEIAEKNENVVGPKARIALAIQAYIHQNFSYCSEQLSKASSILTISKISYKNETRYARYIYQLLEWQKKHHAPISRARDATMLVIGESHALATVGMRPSLDGYKRICKVRWIEGCKQWSLASKEKNIWNQKLGLICKAINEPVDILFTVGEIDCRFDQGIMKHSESNLHKPILEIIEKTIVGFLDVISKMFFGKAKKIIIQGVPYPKMTFQIDDPRRPKHLMLVHDFNNLLKKKSNDFGFGFLDVYEMTKPGNYEYQEEWHLDDVHLRPDYIMEAFDSYLIFAS